MFGPYRLVTMLGRGGMGEVWRAVDTSQDDRTVALKVLGAWLGDAADVTDRFRREAALAASLQSPHIIPIHRYGAIDGRMFIDMPLVDGADLSELIAAGPLDPERAVSIIEQVADALDVAHRARMVHRDVKPSNVLVTGRPGREFVYLVDFGIARSLDGTKITASGAVIGSPDYMAPERFTDDGTGGDLRVDVYALGCVLFQVLTGRTPFGTTSMPAAVHAHLYREPPRPSQDAAGVPAAFDAVIATAMAKDPARRYQSAGALAAAARAALGGGPPVPMPPPRGTPAPAMAPTWTPPAPVAAAPAQSGERQHLATTWTPPASTPPPPPTGPRRGWWMAGIGAGIAVLLVVVIAVTTSNAPSGGAGPSAGGPTGAAGSTTTAAGIAPLTGRAAAPAAQLAVPADAADPAGNGAATCSGVSLAFVGAETGPNAALGINIINGVQLAVTRHNAANPGCQVTTKKYDTAGDPGKAPGVVTQATSAPDVIGAVGLPFSGESKATGAIFEQTGLAHLTPSASNPSLTTSNWRTFFRGLGNDAAQGPAAARFLDSRLQATSVCVIQDGSDYGRGVAQGVTATLGSKAAGCQATVATGQQDFSAVARQVVGARADAVYFGGYYQEGSPLAKQLTAAGFTGAFVSDDGVKDDQFIQLTGSAADGTYVTCPCAPGELAGSFSAAYRSASGGALPGTYSVESYDLATILLAGIDSGATTRQKLLDFVRSYSGDGVAKHYQWTPSGELSDPPTHLYQVQHGQFVYVGTTP
jgi:ABC-type branched-subunit amino acid transport system substrate-binding protein